MPDWHGVERWSVLVRSELDSSSTADPAHVHGTLLLWLRHGLVDMLVFEFHQLGRWLPIHYLSRWSDLERGDLRLSCAASHHLHDHSSFGADR